MTHDLYVATSGLLLASRQLDGAAHNLANVQTPGFRSRQIFAETLGQSANGPTIGSPAGFGGQYEQAGPGPLRQTKDPFHLALLDGGLLRLDTPDGPRYSRAGGLSLDPDGRLLHGSGHPVVDADGFAIVGVDRQSTIGNDGVIRDAQGEVVATLAIEADVDGSLMPVGGGLLALRPGGTPPQRVDEPQVRPGWVEESTTDPFTEIVRMVEVQRSFERLQRIISQNMNDVTRRAVNDIAG